MPPDVMPEEVLPDIFKIDLPLPGVELEYLNSYLIRGNDRRVLVDTGTGGQEVFSELSDRLEEIEVSIDGLTDVVITHFHIDHLGLSPMLIERSKGKIKFMLGEVELELLKELGRDPWRYWDDQIDWAKLNGLPAEVVEELRMEHPGMRASKHIRRFISSFSPLRGGEGLEVGDYRFEFLKTPGHSPDHHSLYEPYKKLLISGDHILKDITPHIPCTKEEEDPLRDYIESLETVKNLGVDMVLPAHGEPFGDHAERIDQIKSHHEERLSEVRSVLDGRSLTAYQVAQDITWDVEYRSWGRTPTLQKWFATLESIAHLKFLKDEGEVQRSPRGGRIYWSLSV